MSMQTFTAKIEQFGEHVDSCNWCSQLRIDGKVPSYRHDDLCDVALRIEREAVVELYNGIEES